MPGIAAAQISSIAVPTIRDAHLNRIQQVVDGYITGRPGDLRISATVRDESGQSTVKTLSAHGTTVVEAAASLAGQLNSTPKPYTSNNPEAIKERSLVMQTLLSAHPAYGAAHVARIEALVRTGRKDELPAGHSPSPSRAK